MLVLAPAACIMSGIALSQAFDVFTASIKYQLGEMSNSKDDVSICFSLSTLFSLMNHLWYPSSGQKKQVCVFYCLAEEKISTNNETKDDASSA